MSGRTLGFIGIVAASLIALLVVSLTRTDNATLEGPLASVWVKSSVSRQEGGKLKLQLDASSLVVRDGNEVVRPDWILAASQIETRIGQADEVERATQAISGTLAYAAPFKVWDFWALRRDTKLRSLSFEFTGEFEQREKGDRWWRLQQCDPEGAVQAVIKSRSAR